MLNGPISPDYKELLLHRLARMRLSPRLYNITQMCNALNINRATLKVWLASDEFLDIKQSYLDKVRNAWEGEIQAIVINRALRGSRYHTDLYFKLQGRLINKVEVTKKAAAVPDKIEEIDKEIDTLIRQTNENSGK